MRSLSIGQAGGAGQSQVTSRANRSTPELDWPISERNFLPGRRRAELWSRFALICLPELRSGRTDLGVSSASAACSL